MQNRHFMMNCILISNNIFVKLYLLKDIKINALKNLLCYIPYLFFDKLVFCHKKKQCNTYVVIHR